jgi:hypothetical protein
MIRINNDIREQKYEAAATQIDAMIADTTVNQQELISRLKFIARLGYKAEELPEFWFNKCVGYLQYIAYNQTDRDDAFIHQEYAAALEMVLRKLNGIGYGWSFITHDNPVFTIHIPKFAVTNQDIEVGQSA